MGNLVEIIPPFSPFAVFAISAIALLLYMLIWAIAAICKKRADLADTAWGFGFLTISWVAFFITPFSSLGLLVNVLVTAWSLRLGIHIFLRNRYRDEDFRYQNLKNSNLRIFFQVFLLQGFILYIIALPILWIHIYPQIISSSVLWTAIPCFVFGFLVELISDYQLRSFQKKPSNHGKLLTTGLWSYCRHPNYLGEIIQWWAIWLLAATLHFGWALIISPLLITFLIIKVSGIAPVEEKMQKNLDFATYKKATPKLIPPLLFNWVFYSIGWIIIIWFGAKGYIILPLLSWVVCFGFQIALFYKTDRNSFVICFPLAIYITVMGFIQEILLIHFQILSYPNHSIFPPFWLLSLYPLFSLTLNSSMAFLSRNLYLAFAVGGVGSLLSYFSGMALGGVVLSLPLAYFVIFFSWGVLLTLLLLLNRRLIVLRDKYTNPENTKEKITVFFDKTCSVCFCEMETLKKRKQTGEVHYACPTSDSELKQITKEFSYKQSMQKIHAIDASGKVMTGTDALSALYARTNLPILAIFLQAPGFRSLFRLFYAIWAIIRPRTQRSL